MIFLLIIAFAGIALYEVPGLVRKKYWREFAVFSFFFLLAFVLALLQTVGVKIPSPIKGIQYVIKDILHLSYK